MVGIEDSAKFLACLCQTVIFQETFYGDFTIFQGWKIASFSKAAPTDSTLNRIDDRINQVNNLHDFNVDHASNNLIVDNNA